MTTPYDLDANLRDWMAEHDRTEYKRRRDMVTERLLLEGRGWWVGADMPLDEHTLYPGFDPEIDRLLDDLGDAHEAKMRQVWERIDNG